MRVNGRRWSVLICVLALVVAGLPTGVAGHAGPTGAPAAVEPTNETDAPPDPANDTIGWEDGYWHNESIDVDQSDGVNESELHAIVSRSMARVEYVRDVEFERRPPVRVINRSRLGEIYEELYAGSNVTDAARTHQNVKYEALFFVGEDTDYLSVQQQNRAQSVLGFYLYGNASSVSGLSAGDIVLVSENESAPRVDEITLSQELFHSLQDQQFRTTGDYDITTEDDSRAVAGVIEGDGNYVDYLYEQRCGDEWNCLIPDRETASTSRHIGIAVYGLVQYSDGPPFVQEVRQEGGWAAVADLYEQPPETTEQYIHPDKYLEDAPTNVTVGDRSNEEWNVLQLDAGVNYATFGEAGVYTMLWYPSYTTGSDEVIPYNNLLDNGSQPDLYNYDHPYSAGWDGDKLYPYVSEDAATNETGYVWKLAWDSPEDAREFADAYRQLLDFHGAREAEGAEDVYIIPEGEGPREFGDAFALTVEDDTVTIVNAPSLADLNGVREGTVPSGASTPSPTPTETPFDFGTATPSPTPTPEPTPTDEATPTPGQPGFGPLAALFALAATALLARRRE